MKVSLLLCLGCLGRLAAAGAADEKPLWTIGRTDAPPVVDGRLDDKLWASAAATCGFRVLRGTGAAVAQTVVYAAYDDAALYVAYHCTGEAENQFVLKAQEYDDSVWNDSEVELFLQPEIGTEARPGSARAGTEARPYCHFMVNAAGVKADELDTGVDLHDQSWNPAWEAATQRTAEGWDAEMGVPWASLGLDGPLVGAGLRASPPAWGVNFARHAPALGELSTWAPVRGLFHDPEQFGTLVWGERGPTARVLTLGQPLPGQHLLQAALSSGTGEVLATLTRTKQPSTDHETTEPQTTDHRPPITDHGSRITDHEPTTTVRVQGGRILPFPMTFPFGADSLAVTVRADGRDLWRQAVPLAIPDLLAQWSGMGEDLPRNPEIRQEWEEMGNLLQAGVPSRDWLATLQTRLDALDARVGDLKRLSAWNRRLGRERAGTEARPYYLTTASTMVKITRDAADPGDLAEAIEIALAKREMEGAQLTLVAPETDLRQVYVSASPLRSAEGAVIPAEQVAVNPVGYVEMKVHTPGAPLSGWVPDPLLPPGPVDVPARQRQSFWITVTTRPDTPAGHYQGRLRVAVEGQPPTYLPLRVRVWNFELPLTPHLRTAFVLWGSLRQFLSGPPSPEIGGGAGGGGQPEAYERAYLHYTRFLLRHRLSPITFRPPIPREGGGYDLSWMDRYLDVAEEEGYTTFNIADNGGVVGRKDADFIRAVADHLKATGRWERAYLYGQDEAPGEAAADLRDKYGALLQAVPDLKIMQTGWSPREALQGFVKVWCPLTAGFDEAACRAAQDRGEEVWWYVCIGPQRPYANFFVDYPALDHRILFWMNWKWNVSGFLYWGTDVWPKNDRPLAEYLAAGYANWDPNSYDGVNGDGYLLYPGPHDEPLASVRLANIRDGIEDYEYFYRLRELAERTRKVALKRRAKALLSLDAPLLASRTEYTLDPALLLEQRAAVAEMIEELQGVTTISDFGFRIDRSPDSAIRNSQFAIRNSQSGTASVPCGSTRPRRGRSGGGGIRDEGRAKKNLAKFSVLCYTYRRRDFLP